MAVYAQSVNSPQLVQHTSPTVAQASPPQRRPASRPRFLQELSQCLYDFVIQLLPTPEELSVKEDVRKLLERLIRTIEPDSRLLSFGSTANGFSLRNSDMDLCCLIDSDERLSAADLVTMLGDLLERETKFHVKPLPHARIPIVKLSLDPSPGLPLGIACDIGFENRLALENTRLLYCYAMIDPTRVRTLVLFLKVWCKRRKINSPYQGTLSSYGYVLMVIYFLVHVKNPPVLPNLQQMPPLRPISHEDSHIGEHNTWFFDDIELLRQRWQSQNTDSVGQLLIDFFKYFSRDFLYNTGVASIRAGLLKKESKGWQNDLDPVRYKDSRERNRLCIEDPFELDFNVARCVTRDGLYLIRGEFMRACRVLAGRPERAIVAIAQLCEERVGDAIPIAGTNPPFVPPRLSPLPPQTPYTVGSNPTRNDVSVPIPDRLPARQALSRSTGPSLSPMPEAGPSSNSPSPLSTVGPTIPIPTKHSHPEHMAPRRGKWTSPPPPEAPEADRASFENRLGLGLELATASTDARQDVSAYASSSNNSEILTDDEQLEVDPDEVLSVQSMSEEPSSARANRIRIGGMSESLPNNHGHHQLHSPLSPQSAMPSLMYSHYHQLPDPAYHASHNYANGVPTLGPYARGRQQFANKFGDRGHDPMSPVTGAGMAGHHGQAIPRHMERVANAAAVAARLSSNANLTAMNMALTNGSPSRRSISGPARTRSQANRIPHSQVGSGSHLAPQAPTFIPVVPQHALMTPLPPSPQENSETRSSVSPPHVFYETYPTKDSNIPTTSSQTPQSHSQSQSRTQTHSPSQHYSSPSPVQLSPYSVSPSHHPNLQHHHFSFSPHQQQQQQFANEAIVIHAPVGSKRRTMAAAKGPETMSMGIPSPTATPTSRSHFIVNAPSIPSTSTPTSSSHVQSQQPRSPHTVHLPPSPLSTPPQSSPSSAAPTRQNSFGAATYPHPSFIQPHPSLASLPRRPSPPSSVTTSHSHSLSMTTIGAPTPRADMVEFAHRREAREEEAGSSSATKPKSRSRSRSRSGSGSGSSQTGAAILESPTRFKSARKSSLDPTVPAFLLPKDAEQALRAFQAAQARSQQERPPISNHDRSSSETASGQQPTSSEETMKPSDSTSRHDEEHKRTPSSLNLDSPHTGHTHIPLIRPPKTPPQPNGTTVLPTPTSLDSSINSNSESPAPSSSDSSQYEPSASASPLSSSPSSPVQGAFGIGIGGKEGVGVAVVGAENEGEERERVVRGGDVHGKEGEKEMVERLELPLALEVPGLELDVGGEAGAEKDVTVKAEVKGIEKAEEGVTAFGDEVKGAFKAEDKVSVEAKPVAVANGEDDVER